MECNDYKMNFVNFKVSLLARYFLLALLTISSCYVSAQNSTRMGKQFYKVISFGEKIQFGNVENNAKWTITNAKENVYDFSNGNQINDYVFAKTGTYEITYSETQKHNADECSHAQFDERMTIQVNPIKMTFDFSKISFSGKIQKGSNCDHIYITVPVTVVMKDLQTTKFVVPNVTVAGIGSEIIAKPVTSEVVLKNGTQLLKYQLSGIATKEAYLMFDFVDSNNNIQTYYQPEIVN